MRMVGEWSADAVMSLWSSAATNRDSLNRMWVSPLLLPLLLSRHEQHQPAGEAESEGEAKAFAHIEAAQGEAACDAQAGEGLNFGEVREGTLNSTFLSCILDF